MALTEMEQRMQDALDKRAKKLQEDSPKRDKISLRDLMDQAEESEEVEDGE